MNRPRIAIAHDYLTQRGGAERVVLALSRAFPEAVVHTTLYNPSGTYPEFREVPMKISPLNRVKFLRSHHRAALPILPFASNRLHIDADVVIASSSGWAHGFRTSGKMLVYCHSPARWLYRQSEYLGTHPQSRLTAIVIAMLRPFLVKWDQRAAQRADRYLANSTVIAERIKNVYGIDSDVVFPPFGLLADGDEKRIEELKDWADDGYFLVVSRLLPYKNVDQAIAAVAGSSHRLVVVGAGPMRDELASHSPDNVRLVSEVSDAQLRWIYRHSTALIAPSYEDFGLTPLEAGEFGKPVAALRAGGYLDTVVDGETGLFFDAPLAGDIASTLDRIASTSWDEEAIERHAVGFDEARFAERIRLAVEELETEN